MTRHLTPLLWVLLILFFVLLGLIGNSRSSEISHSGPPNFDDAGFNSIDQAASGSILPISSKLETRLIALPDGRILLMHQDNEKVIWSFSSGPLIYSLYRAPFDRDNERKYPSTRNGFDYVDYRENGKLYAHTKQDTILELPAIEQFISSTPMILEDGEIVLGSKKTTVFLVDAKNGRLIRTYGSSDSPSMMQTKEEESVLYDRNKLVESSSVEQKDVELPLYITRTDYTLKSFAANSSKVLWKLAVAEFGAAYLCPNMENAFEEASTNSGNEPGSPFGMPLPCQSKVVVYPIRNNDKLKSMLTLGVLPETLEFALTQLIPSQPAVDKYLDYDHDNIMLPVPASRDMLPSEPPFDRILDFQSNRNEIALHPSSSKKGNWGKSYLQNVRIYGVIIALCGFLFVYFIRRYAVVDEKQVELDGQHNDSNVKTQSSKRKKVRKSGKNNGSVEKKDRPLSSGNENGFAHIQSDNTPWSNLNKLIGGAEGRKIGKLFVSNREIAKGSNGTVVLEGIYEGRPVAVKRLVQAHHDVAFKEIQNLIVSDRHPNIVRWYGVEYDQDFVYLSLERCTCSLDDLIQIWSTSSEHSVVTQEQASSSMTEYKVQLDSVKAVIRDANLWTENGYASPMLLKLMRDVVSGLVHLHELGIIHRDLKPQNVLISEERSLCAKLSDMGISKRLLENMSSLDHHATGCGSSGWQAPEQLLHGRQTRAVDLFSLGCVLFFCITGGKHPFGDRLERDYNIVKNQVDLFLVECIPEAVDLFSQLLNPDPELRPKALEVLNHPLFWDSEMRLSFLRDASDRVELEDRETKSDILHAVEGIASMALGTKWDEKMELEFIANIGRYRRYKYDSVRDLLRVMRNKLNHYRELPKEIQDLLGPVPEGFDRYFASRFPKLLTEVYKVVRKFCREEECFQKYFKAV